MTSKKRSGNDPEVLAGNSGGRSLVDRGRAIRAIAEAGGGANTPGKYRGSDLGSAYLAGRRSLAYELVESGMLNSGRLGLEILYLLPDEFVQFYQDLFHRALQVKDDSVMHGRSGGLEKASGRQGMQLGSSDRGPQAGGGGKRWKNTPMAVGNETALKAKESMDKGLEDLVRSARRYMNEVKEGGGIGGSRGGGDEGRRSQGPGAVSKADHVSTPGQPKVASSSTRCAGAKCGRFLKADWKFCPECGTSR